MDDADITQSREAIIMQANLSNSKRHVPTTQYTGHCLFCNEPVEANRRWCNAQCRDDWELVNE